MKFYLIRPNLEHSSIFADINFRKFRIRISTKIIISTKNWIEKSETVSSKESHYSLSNARLKQIRAAVDTVIAQYKIKNEFPNFDTFSNDINIIFGNNRIDQKNEESELVPQNIEIKDEIKYFAQIFKEWIEGRIASGRFAKGHLKRYKSTLNHYIRFEAKIGKKLTLEEIDLKFYDDFIKYLQIDKNLVDSSIGAAFKPINTFLNYLKENTDIKVSGDVQKFKVFRDNDPPTFAFEENEIEAIEKLELTDENLIKTRDLFFVQLHTLQRISDLFQYSKEHLDLKNRTIKITQIKTKEPVLLPLSQKTLEIFKRYNFKLPKFSESEDKNRQKYNENLLKTI